MAYVSYILANNIFGPKQSCTFIGWQDGEIDIRLGEEIISGRSEARKDAVPLAYPGIRPLVLTSSQKLFANML